MVMNRTYSRYCSGLMKKENYAKIIQDADSPKILIENMQKKYESFVNEFLWNPISYVGSGINGNWTDAEKFARSKIKEIYTTLIKPQINENIFSLQAINENAVYAICNKYDELVNKFVGLSGTLEILKDNLGSKALSVDNKNYEIRIDEIIGKINTYKMLMEEFTTAVRERTTFVHDFQVAVQKDYIRYFGHEGGYGNPKNWDRENSGWEL